MKRLKKFAGVTVAITSMALTVACSDDDPLPLNEANQNQNHIDPVWGLQTLQPVTMGARRGQCPSATDGEASMQWVFFDDRDQPMVDGTAEISMDGGKIYSLPDLRCANDGECSPLVCEPGESIDERCQIDTALTVDSGPEFVGDPDASSAVAVAIADVGRWRGWYSDDFSGYYEFREDGPNRPLNSAPVEAVAVDPDMFRESSLRTMVNEWSRATETGSEASQDHHYGLWTFGESAAEVNSRVASTVPDGSVWTTETSEAADAVHSLPSARQGRSDIYNAMMVVLEQAFGDQDLVDADHRELIVVVAGHDERRRTVVDTVINEATFLGVAVSIVQIDAPRQVDLLRDDWVYYQSSSPCSDDSECANFETCRQPTPYTTSESTNSFDDIDFPSPDQQGHSFCLPHYAPDADGMGRLGPIADYQRLACETGGRYAYIPSNRRSAIEDRLKGLTWAPHAGWEVDFTIQEASVASGALSPYRLATTVEVTVDGVDEQLALMPGEAWDRRGLFFAP